MDLYLSDSDWDSSSDSGMEDQEVDFLYGGQAQSILSSLEQSIEKIDDLLSFERGFVHGDMVFSANDPSGQMGRVIGIDMLVDLESVHGKTIKRVNSKNLSKIRSFSAGDYVVCGPWIGKIDNVVDRITIIFDDGTKYEVNSMDQDKILPLSPNILEDAQFPYYPGQRVQVKPSTASKSAKWLCGTWRENQDEGTVCSVEAGLIYVDWIASVLAVSNPDLSHPPHLLDSKKLTPLSCFLHANWQLGDWCKLSISGHNPAAEKPFTCGNTLQLIKHKNMETTRRNLGSKVEEIFEIVKTKTNADVVWQDGSVSQGLDSQTLLPVTIVNSYEFWPEQFVLEKGTDDEHMFSGQKWGVVLGMDAKERTVKVQWKTLATSETKDLKCENMVETVSAYELVEHPDFSYGLGAPVFRLVQNKNDTQADADCLSREFEEADKEGNYCGRDMNKFPDGFLLSCIGSVVGFEHGSVVVKWASGVTSMVAPTEIYLIDKSENTAAVSEDQEEIVDLNEVMIEHDMRSSRDKRDLLNSDDIIVDNHKKHLWESSSFFLPQAAIGFFTNIAASLLGASGTTVPLGSTPLIHVLEAESKPATSSANEVISGVSTETQMTDEVGIFSEKISNHEAKQILRDNDYSADNEIPGKFRRFDMVTDCPDHQFLNPCKGFSLSQVKRSWLRKVQQEWSILEKNLPDTIYVRIFEERMDLVRAAIIGAPGTPYHDGLFLFDIYLPPEYPHEPPMVHYNSGGLRLNPNLYESGKVCLSLLNTWAGSDTEVWNPESSTILQVLLSLQALVLNEKPYFNEAGFDQQIGKAEGEKNSVSYNENVYLATCKSMLYLLRKPPKHFEDLVEEHFGRRSQHILTSCKEYMDGAPVGCDGFSDKTEHGHHNGSSTGFKIMLSKLFPKLIEAFSEKGIDCSQV